MGYNVLCLWFNSYLIEFEQRTIFPQENIQLEYVLNILSECKYKCLNPTFFHDLNHGYLFTQFTGTSSKQSSKLQHFHSPLKVCHMGFGKPQVALLTTLCVYFK